MRDLLKKKKKKDIHLKYIDGKSGRGRCSHFAYAFRQILLYFNTVSVTLPENPGGERKHLFHGEGAGTREIESRDARKYNGKAFVHSRIKRETRVSRGYRITLLFLPFCRANVIGT